MVAVRVNAETHIRATQLAARAGTSVGEIIAEALDAYETAEFWRQTRQALAEHHDALAIDPAWERAGQDGLHHD